MKCHYEVLQVERDANDDQIKKNYRKLALRWHPDKNPDNIDECTQQFRLLQAAYDVLSDVREREFYDRHRESILKGKNSDFEEESVDLFPYFSASCYQGYGDDKNGFYAVYQRVFKMLVTEEYDPDNLNFVDYPDFGTKDSDPESIVNGFYGVWMSFSTNRSFAWLDHYDITQASNRYESRQIDMENKKYRDRGKADRNEQIRELVTFVRKRDPRVKAYREALEKKKEEALQKQHDNRKKQIAKNQELAELHLNDKEAEAARLAHLIEVSLQMAEDYETCSDECDEEGVELPYCVVCSKSFKTSNAKLNHENSKQHIRQLSELKKHLKEEDASLFLNQETEHKFEHKSDRKNRRKDRKKGNTIFGGVDNEADCVDDFQQKPIDVEEINETDAAVEEKDKDSELEVTKKEKKKRRADKNNKNTGSLPVMESSDAKSTRCDKCHEEFDTRTKLFSHLNETGHATLLIKKAGLNDVAQTKKTKNKKGQKGKKYNDNDDDW